MMGLRPLPDYVLNAAEMKCESVQKDAQRTRCSAQPHVNTICINDEEQLLIGLPEWSRNHVKAIYLDGHERKIEEYVHYNIGGKNGKGGSGL